MRVVPQLQVRWDLVVSTAIYMLLLVGGGHFFLRWLYRKLQPGERPWRIGWTLRGFTLVLLMFVAGIAMVGMTHQTVWIARSPEPMFTQDRRGRRLHCATNLRRIGQHLWIYANQHGGNYPDDFRALVLEDDDLTPDLFVCVSGTAETAHAPTTREVAEMLLQPEHMSYLYFGKGLKEPVAADQVIAIDRPGNHGMDGINVLFPNGRVEWQAGETMLKTLDALKARPSWMKGTQ
jgi:hypothetical protein